MGNIFSIPPPESTPMSDTSEKMPDFNKLFQECVPKMMKVTDDLHQMVLLQSSNIKDLQNMIIELSLKYRNGKQKRRRRSNRGKHRFNDIRSEHSFIGNRYMNENSDAFMSKVPAILIGGNSDAHSDGSFDDVLICGECRFRTNDINKFADHKSRKCSNITKAPSEPESIQCCENTFKNSWKLLERLTEKHNLNLYRDASTTDDSQEISRETLCNKNSPILYDSTDAHEMSKDYCIGEIVDEEKQTYTYDKKPISPTTPTSMPYYSDPTATAYGTPPLTTSVSTAATPSVSSLNVSKDMIKAQVFAGNLNEVCCSREMLCNENSPILCDSTDAHEMSKDYCNGEIVNEEKQTYTYDKKPISPTASTSTTSGDFNGLNKNTSTITVGYLNTASNSKIGTTKQTNFNQHTTNFIICCSDSLKPFV